MLSCDRSDITKDYILCASFLLFFTASDGSHGTTAGRAVSPRSNHGFGSKEARHARKQNIDHAKQHHTPQCWMPSKVMYPVNSTKHFSWLTLSTPIPIVEERPYIYNHCHLQITTFMRESIKYLTADGEKCVCI